MEDVRGRGEVQGEAQCTIENMIVGVTREAMNYDLITGRAQGAKTHGCGFGD